MYNYDFIDQKHKNTYRLPETSTHQYELTQSKNISDNNAEYDSLRWDNLFGYQSNEAAPLQAKEFSEYHLSENIQGGFGIDISKPSLLESPEQFQSGDGWTNIFDYQPIGSMPVQGKGISEHYLAESIQDSNGVDISRLSLLESPEIQLTRVLNPYSGRELDLPESLVDSIQGGFGIDMSKLSLLESPDVAQMGAKATAQGNVIRFAPGQYNPDTTEGLELLGHELNHVREQAQGKVQANVEGTNIHFDPMHEASCDRVGEAFASGELNGAESVSVGNASMGGTPIQCSLLLAGGLAAAAGKKALPFIGRGARALGRGLVGGGAVAKNLRSPEEEAISAICEGNCSPDEVNANLEAWLIHGTTGAANKPGSGPDQWTPEFQNYLQEQLGICSSNIHTPDWGGALSQSTRRDEGYALASQLNERLLENPELSILLAGYSHGGNVSIRALNRLHEHYQQDISNITLATIGTPIRDDYTLNPEANISHHINVFNEHDHVQRLGGQPVAVPTGGRIGRFGPPQVVPTIIPGRRQVEGAENIEVQTDVPSGFWNNVRGGSPAHGFMHSNPDVWDNYIIDPVRRALGND